MQGNPKFHYATNPTSCNRTRNWTQAQTNVYSQLFKRPMFTAFPKK